jgi:hypothetical protein
MLSSTMKNAAREVTGRDMELEIICQAPLIADAWWEAYECPHGNEYWLRPTVAQQALWTERGTP